MSRAGLNLGAARRAQGPILLLIGALVMHWLCYLPNADASSAGAQAVHSYLIGITPAAIAVGISVLAASLLAPLTSSRLPARSVDVERRAARYAAVLIALFFAQELAEVLLAHGSGGAEAYGEASFLAAPLAFALGLIAAVLERGLLRAEHRLLRVLRVRPLRREPARGRPSTSHPINLAAQTLAFGLARRGPPLPS